MRINILSAGLLSVLLGGCATGIEVSGDYSCKEVCQSFSLNRDATFRFEDEASSGFSDGHWFKYKGDQVVLNSVIKDRSLPLKTFEFGTHEFGQESLLSFDIGLLPTEKPYYQCLVYVNDTLYQKRNCDSLTTIPIKNEVYSLRFDICGNEKMPGRMHDTLHTELYHPRAVSGNKFQIHILFNDSLFNYRVFDNEVFKVTKKGLRVYNPTTKQWDYIGRKKPEDALVMQ